MHEDEDFAMVLTWAARLGLAVMALLTVLATYGGYELVTWITGD